MKNKLDLHGMRHEDAVRAAIEFIEDHWGKPTELNLVTGNSLRMKELVTDVLKEYKLTYRIGDAFGVNTGHITAWIE